MRIARVIGTVVGAAHHPAYESHKILVVKPEQPNGKGAGSAFIAVDQVQAGVGDRVLVLTEGNGVRQILGADSGPIRSLIVGIIDHIEYDDAQTT
tara:strand:- start:105 stop:389 length:285 start_codon:yes stop_codon:yes gene_type:complete